MTRFFLLTLLMATMVVAHAESIDSLHFALNSADQQIYVTAGTDSIDFGGVAMSDDQLVRVLVDKSNHTLTNLTAYHDNGTLALSILFYDATDTSVRFNNEQGERIERDEWMVHHGALIRRKLQKSLPNILLNLLEY